MTKSKTKAAPRKNKQTGPKAISDVMLEASIRKHGAVLSVVARDLGCTRSNLTMRVQRSEKMQEVIREVEETLLDAAEGVVLNAIVKDSDGSMARWYLTQKGKKRGYANRSETEVRLHENDLDALARAFAGDVDGLRALRTALTTPTTG